MTIARSVIHCLFAATFVTQLQGQTWIETDGPGGGTVLTIARDTATKRWYAGGVHMGLRFTNTMPALSWATTPARPAGDSTRSVVVWSPRSLVVATERGLFFTRDTGHIWQAGVMQGRSAAPLVIARAGHQLLAGTVAAGVYTSTDSGATWKPTTFASASVYAFARTDAGTWYAATSAGVMRSQDGGTTWTNAGLAGMDVTAIAADGSDIYASIGNRITRSRSGSLLFEDVGAPLAARVAVLAARAPGKLVAGTDAGLLQLDSAATGWVSAGAPTQHAVRSIWADSLDMLIGHADVGMLWRQRTYSWNWTNRTVAFSSVLALAQNDQTERVVSLVRGHVQDLSSYNRRSWTNLAPNEVLRRLAVRTVHAFDGVMYAAGDSGVLLTSTNTGSLWNAAAASPGVRISSLSVDARGVLWAATEGKGVARTSDRGGSWTLHASGLADTRVRVVLALSAGGLLAGTASAGLYRSDDDGASWVAVHPAGGDPILSIVANHEGLVYAATRSTVLRSTDWGASWTVRTRPGTGAITSLVVATTGIVFAGVDGDGVFRSDDGAASWQARTTGLGNLHVRALAADYGGFVFAGTDGNGVFVTDASQFPTLPKRVVLELPVNGATIDKGTLNLMWRKVNNTTYRVQTALDSTFAVLVDDSSGLTETVHLPSLENGRRYFWRVRAENAGLAGQWSEVRSFTLAVPRPEAPVLNAPQDGATDIPTEAPFSWNSAKGAVTFDLQLSFSPSFDTLQREVTEIPRIYVTVGALRAMRTYYWRVRGRGIYDVGPWSEVRRFTTWLRVPPPPQLLIPTNGVANVPTTALLRWNPADAAVTYRVQVAKNVAFFPVLMDIDLIAGTSRQITGLDALTTYHWRVLGRNSVGEGLWSAAWSFTTDDGAPPPPLLHTPAHEAVHVVQQGGVMRWSRVANALRYRVQLAHDTSFTRIVLDDDTVVDTVRAMGTLERGALYAWRVRSAGASGVGAWSPASVFTTARGVPDVPVVLAPADGAVSQPLSLELTWQPSPWADTHLLQLATDAAFTSLLVDTLLAQSSCSVGPLADSATFFWRLAARNDEGTSAWSAARRFTTVRVLGIDAPTAAVRTLAVHPHPVRDRAVVTLELDAASVVRIELLDLLGRTLGTVADGFRSAGRHEMQVDVQDLPAGPVLVRATAAGRPPVIRILHIIH